MWPFTVLSDTLRISKTSQSSPVTISMGSVEQSCCAVRAFVKYRAFLPQSFGPESPIFVFADGQFCDSCSAGFCLGFSVLDIRCTAFAYERQLRLLIQDTQFMSRADSGAGQALFTRTTFDRTQVSDFLRFQLVFIICFDVAALYSQLY